MSKSLDLKKAFDYVKNCKDKDFKNLKDMNLCIKVTDNLRKNISENYIHRREMDSALNATTKRLVGEKNYKILYRDNKLTEENVFKINYGLRLIRDKERVEWDTLTSVMSLKKEDIKVEQNNVDLLSISLVIIILLGIYFISSFFNGSIWMKKVMVQLKTLKENELAAFMEKMIYFNNKNDFKIFEKYIFQRYDKKDDDNNFWGSISHHDKVLLEKIEIHKNLINEAYKIAMQPIPENLSEEEKNKFIDELSGQVVEIMNNFYQKIGYEQTNDIEEDK